MVQIVPISAFGCVFHRKAGLVLIIDKRIGSQIKTHCVFPPFDPGSSYEVKVPVSAATPN